jgi:hypothetical protein
MGNLLFGFIAIVNASQGQYVISGICILFAALLDGFDGQIARMLREELNRYAVDIVSPPLFNRDNLFAYST